jgi:hypothetical protein
VRVRFERYAGAVLVLAMLAGCVSTLAPAPPPSGAATAPAPDIKAGSYWEYAVRDGYTGASRGTHRYTVTRVEGDRVFVDVTREGERAGSFIFTREWKGIEHPLRNLQPFRFDPPYPAFEFPMYAGERWRSIVNSTDPATGKTYRTHVHVTVNGWRRIRVPAGEFDALEVRRSVYAGNSDSFRHQEEIVETDFYAPSVGFLVASGGASSHIDTSRGGGGRFDPPLRVQGDWLIAELVRYAIQ